jgi:hypothetical protein
MVKMLSPCPSWWWWSARVRLEVDGVAGLPWVVSQGPAGWMRGGGKIGLGGEVEGV